MIINHNRDDYRDTPSVRLSPGFAISQRLTADRVLVNMDTKVHPVLINTRFAYVSVSRAGQEASLVADALARLIPPIRRG